MKTFIKNIKSEKPFFYKNDDNHFNTRFLGVPDDNVSNVFHIYFDDYAKSGKAAKKLSHGGIIINDTMWDLTYALTFSLNMSKEDENNIKQSSLIEKELNGIIEDKVTAAIYSEAHDIAMSLLEFGKKDFTRIKSEPLTEEEKKYNRLDFTLHQPRVSLNILNHLNENKQEYAYEKFYNTKSDKLPKLVKSEITQSELLEYLAAEESDKENILNRYIQNLIKNTRKEIKNPESKIINKLIRHILVTETYDKLLADKNGRHYLVKKVYDSVHKNIDTDAKTVNITVEIEGKSFKFSLNKDSIQHNYTISTYNITPATIKKEINEKLKERYNRLNDYLYNNILMDDILEITYKRKPLYKKINP